MYKRKAKPDLMFLLTVFVCLGVLVTATVQASEPAQPGWGMTIGAENDCRQSIGEWQACSRWQGLGDKPESGLQRATISFFHEQRPDMGLIWYYSQPSQKRILEINDLYSDDISQYSSVDQTSGQFGVAFRQQYQHFGFSLGIESENALPTNDDAVLFFGVSNRW